MKRVISLLICVLLVFSCCSCGYSESDLDSAKQAGIEIGHEEGYIEGHSEGHEKGFDDGYNSGYKSGYSDGYADGWDAYEDEHTYSYSSGYSDYSGSTDTSATVYITATGAKYHSYGCQYLSKSCYSISLNDAIASGYTACSWCW